MQWKCSLGALALCAIVPLGRTAAQMIVYVDDTATGAANGTSWQNAFVQLQDGLAAAHAGDQVWVAEGIYRPDLGAGLSPGDRNASFALKTGVQVYGGFAGTEGGLAERAGLFDQTVLSGDLAGYDQPGFAGYEENSLHVVRGDSVDATAVLDGFTIRGGYADGPFVGSALLLGTTSGTSPGIPISPVVLPLNLSSYLLATVYDPQGSPLEGSFDILDLHGTATATFTLSPSGTTPALAGTTVHHAFLVFSATGGVELASNPVALGLDP